MPTLRDALDALASDFAEAVLRAIRSASLDELLAEGGSARGSERGKKPKGKKDKKKGGRLPKDKRTGPYVPRRLARRSPEQIATTLANIVSLLKTKRAGLRSEEIRKQLRLDVREVPRVLKEGLSKKVIKSRGKKRATVYTVA